MLRHWSQHGDTMSAAGDLVAVRTGVEQHLHDALAIGSLRGIASELAEKPDLSRCDDHQLADLLAAALLSGRLHLGRQAPPVLRPLVPRRGPPASAAPPPAVGRSRQSAPGAAATAADTMFGADLDAAAMVDALQRAARDGVPFCEECTRAAQSAAESPA